jgi:hypothetical protein
VTFQPHLTRGEQPTRRTIVGGSDRAGSWLAAASMTNFTSTSREIPLKRTLQCSSAFISLDNLFARGCCIFHYNQPYSVLSTSPWHRSSDPRICLLQPKHDFRLVLSNYKPGMPSAQLLDSAHRHLENPNPKPSRKRRQMPPSPSLSLRFRKNSWTGHSV